MIQLFFDALAIIFFIVMITCVVVFLKNRRAQKQTVINAKVKREDKPVKKERKIDVSKGVF